MNPFPKQRRPDAGAPRRGAGLLFRVLLVWTVFASFGCGEDPADSELERTFRGLVDAVGRQDGPALWDLTTQRFHGFCDTLHKELLVAERQVRAYFPEWQQQGLLASLAHDRLGGAEDGRALFLKLLDFGKIRAGEEVQAGLAHEPPFVQGDRATVRTTAGETFTFVRENGEWRTDVYDTLPNVPLVETLRENVRTITDNVARLRELYRSSSAPKTPEGAFNELRDALAKGRGPVALTLLEEPARKAIGELSRKLVEIAALLAREKATWEPRLAAARLEGIDLTALGGSDRSLVEALARKGLLPELLGIHPESAVHIVQLLSSTEATVVTTEAEEFTFLRESDGMWHLTDVANDLRETLLAPLTATETAPER